MSVRASPIIFDEQSIKDIQNGKKTMMRVVVNPQPVSRLTYVFAGSDKRLIGKWMYPRPDEAERLGDSYKHKEFREEAYKWTWTPPCGGDDILYVREPYKLNDPMGDFEQGDKTACITYATDNVSRRIHITLGTESHLCNKFHPASKMRKELARIFLRVKEVRTERLQEITLEDAIREGCEGEKCDCANSYIAGGVVVCTDCYNTGWIMSPQAEYMMLWDSQKDKLALLFQWKDNPFVWVISFEKCGKPEVSG